MFQCPCRRDNAERFLPLQPEDVACFSFPNTTSLIHRLHLSWQEKLYSWKLKIILGEKKSTSKYPTSFAKNLSFLKSGISRYRSNTIDFFFPPSRGSSGFYANGWELWIQTGFPAPSLHLRMESTPKATKCIIDSCLPATPRRGEALTTNQLLLLSPKTWASLS